MGDSAEAASIRETMKKQGYSEKIIEEVLKWYGAFEKAEPPQEK